jgi:hypothetical protein
LAEVVTSPNKVLLPAQTTTERPEGSWSPPEMSATQNPLVPPHPPPPWRHCGIQTANARDYYAQSREPGSCVTWLPPLMEADPWISKIREIRLNYGIGRHLTKPSPALVPSKKYLGRLSVR